MAEGKQTEFDSDDETRIFGKRRIVEIEGGVFECLTLASFNFETKTPKVSSASGPETTVLAVDNDVAILTFNKDEQQNEKIRLDSSVDCIACTQDGKFFIAALNNGVVLVYEIAKNELIFSKTVARKAEPGPTFSTMFCDMEESSISIIVATVYAKIIRIKIDESMELHVSELHIEDTDSITSACIIPNADGSRLAFAGNKISLHSAKDFSLLANFPLLDRRMIVDNICYCPDASCLLALFSNGCVITLCPESLFCSFILDTTSTVVQMSPVSKSEDSPEQLLILSKLQSQYSITMLKTQNFEEVYSFEVGEMVHLVDNFENTNDVMFLEKDNRAGNNLLLRTISKSLPEFRLRRLIRQQKYGDAVSFATKYQLDTQQVYKAQATHYLNTTIDESNMSKLLAALAKIEDCDFVAELCLKATMPSVEQTLQLLEFGDSQASNGVHHRELLSFAKQKLKTLSLIFSEADDADWQEFYRCDDLMALISLLLDGNVDNACILWRCLEDKYFEVIQAEVIPTLIEIVPSSIEPSVFLKWLQLYVPSVLRRLPLEFSGICSTLLKTIEKLVLLKTENWSWVALDFCAKVMKILEPEDLNKITGWLIEWKNPDSPLKDLKSLHRSLANLHNFREKLEVNLNLEEHDQLKTIDELHMMIKKIPSRKLTYFMNNLGSFLSPDIENCLDGEEIASSYIEFEVNSKQPLSSSREERIFIIFDFLSSHEKILSCTNVILRSASIPWSMQMEAFASKAETLSDLTAVAVQSQRRMARIKQVLIKYDLQNLITKGEAKFDKTFALSKIFSCELPEMLEDAMVIGSESKKFELDVHIMYINHLLQKLNMKGAIKYADSLEPEVQSVLLYRFVIKAQSLKYFEACDELVEVAAFIDHLKHAQSGGKFVSSDVEYYELVEMISEINEAVKYYEMHRNTPNEYCLPKDFAEAIEEASAEGNRGTMIQKAERWGQALGKTPNEILLRLVLHNWSKEKVDLLQWIVEKFSPVSISGNEMDILLEFLPKIDESSIEMIEIMQTLVGATFFVCPPERLADVSKLASMITDTLQILRHGDLQYRVGLDEELYGSWEVGMTPNEDPFKTWSYSPLYDDKPMNVAASSETLAILHSIPLVIPVQNEVILERFLNSLDLMQIQHCDQLTLCIICRFLATNTANRNLMLKLNEKKLQLVYSLLEKVLREKKADLFLTLVLLENLSFAEAAEWLEKSIARVRLDSNHLFRMTQLAIDYSLLHKNLGAISRLVKYHTYARWGKFVKKLGLSTRDVMSSQIEDKGQVLQQIMRANPNLSIDTMYKFCEDFGGNVDIEIVALVQSLILSWQPNVQYKIVGGVEKMVIGRDKQFERRISTLVHRLQQNSYGGLEKKLDSIWDKVNVYHYEMYECLLKIKKLVNPDATDRIQSDVLLFLEAYERTTPPHGAEVEKWIRSHPEGTMLPKLALIRLPFPSFLQEVDTIIKSEVNLKNYRIWLKAASVLNCEPDQICVAAVTNSVGSEVCLTNLEKWNPKSNDSFVNEINECVNCMQDGNAAAAILDYASKRIPLGKDRLSLTDLCLEKLTEQGSIPEAIEERVSQRLILYCIVNLLNEHKLARLEYLELASKPEELINALYQDPSITERVHGGVASYPDIHALAGNIGHIADLDVQRIRSNILGNLLFPESSGYEALDASVIDVTMAWQQYNKEAKISNKETCKKLLMAEYMLEAGDKVSHVEHILGICNNPNIACTNLVRLRAWRLLLRLIPVEEIANYTEMDKPTLIEHLNVLYFLSELEVVRGKLEFTSQQFKGMDKVTVIDGLWRNLSDNPRALSLISAICLYYHVGSLSTWCNVLSKMVQLEMDPELEVLLPILNSHVNLFAANPFVEAWGYMITAPFLKANNPMKEEDLKLCIKSMELMQKCPITNTIKFQVIFETCLRKGKPELAAVLLPYFQRNLIKPAVQLLLDTTVDLENELMVLKAKFPGLPITKAAEIIATTV